MQRPPADNIIYGVQPVREALRTGREIKKIFLAREKLSEPVQDILRCAGEKRIPVDTCSRQDVERMCRGAVHQGIAALTGPYRYAALEDIVSAWKGSGEDGAILLLDGILDPVNLGSLIRTAAAWGVHGIVIPKDRAAKVTPAVIKISAGGTEYVPIALVTNLSQAIQHLKREGFWIYGADPESKEDLPGISLDDHVGCVIGGEGQGLRTTTKKHCDVLFRIPATRIIPFNAAVAGAIVLYELMRQRSIKHIKNLKI